MTWTRTVSMTSQWHQTLKHSTLALRIFLLDYFECNLLFPFISLALIWNINTSLQTIWSWQLSLLGTFHQFHHFYLQLVNCDTAFILHWLLISTLRIPFRSSITIVIAHTLCIRSSLHPPHHVDAITAQFVFSSLIWLYPLPVVRLLSHCIPL